MSKNNSWFINGYGFFAIAMILFVLIMCVFVYTNIHYLNQVSDLKDQCESIYGDYGKIFVIKSDFNNSLKIFVDYDIIARCEHLVTHESSILKSGFNK